MVTARAFLVASLAPGCAGKIWPAANIAGGTSPAPCSIVYGGSAETMCAWQRTCTFRSMQAARLPAGTKSSPVRTGHY